MRPIILTRSNELNQAVEYLCERGVPVERALESRALPVSPEALRDSYVAAIPALQFIQYSEQTQGIDDIVFAVYGKHYDTDLKSYTAAGKNPANTFVEAIRRFNRHAEAIVPGYKTFILQEKDDIVVGGQLPQYIRSVTRHHWDWMAVLQMISMAREYIGHDWRPKHISLGTPFRPCAQVREAFPNTIFQSSVSWSSIRVPTTLLTKKPISRRPHVLHENNATEIFQELTFCESLKLALRSYLATGHPKIETAAEIAGVSVRTLQRRIGEAGTTYTALLKDVTFETARELLCKTDMKATDIAYFCGYADPSHFSRAFRRTCGISPREYRRAAIDAA